MRPLIKRLFALATISLLVISGSTLWHVFNAGAVTYTWDNEAGDGLWSSCTNWTTDTCPTSADIAQFDPAISDTSSTIDASFGGSVLGINMMSGFTGTITQARTLTVGSSGFVLTAGTFTGASQAIDINGPLTLTAGTFTSTSGTLTLSGALTVGSGNTFTHNSGTFTFDGAGDRNVDVDTSETFNNLTLNPTAAGDDVFVLSGDTLISIGTLTLTNGQLGSGTIESQGTLSRGTGFDGGAGVVHVTGAAVRNITWSSGSMSGLHLDGANTTISVTSSATFTYEGDVTVTQGTLTHASATNNTVLSTDFLVNGGTYVATPLQTLLNGETWGVTSGTFAHSSGIVVFQSSDPVVVSGATTFYDLMMVNTDNAESFTLPAGQTQTVVNYAWIGTRNPADTLGTRIPVESSSAGVQANFDFQGQVAMFNVSLKDIASTGGTVNCPSRCSDRGNNSAITFTGSIGVTVSDPLTSTSETGTATTFTVALDSEPTANVSVPITSTDTGEGAVSASTLTFTSGNWDTAQTVTVTGVDDDESDGAVSYTVTVGAATSSDSNYSGVDPRDVTVTNVDDDSATAAIEFEEAADFTLENVKNSTGVAITHYEHSYDGHGVLYTADGGSIVDITNSRIKEGCVITISGVDYTILKVTDEPTYGYNVSLQRDNLSASAMDAELSASLGAVTNIRCLELDGGVAKLNDGYINVERIEIGGWWSVYDSTNDKIWSPDDGTTGVDSIDIATGATSSFTSSGATKGIVYDSENDRIWVANRSTDNVTVFDAADGSYAFGTLGASTFAVGDSPALMVYDSVNNAVWVTHDGTGNAIVKLSTVDGSTLGTYAVGNDSYGIAYDSVRDVVWAAVGGGFYEYLVELDGATGAYENGTLANSSYILPVSSNTTVVRYDATNDVLWILDEENSTAGFVHKIDPATGKPLGMYVTGVTPLDIAYKASTDELWASDSSSSTWTVLDAATGRTKASYLVNDCAEGLAIDSDGDIWGSDCAFGTQDRVVPNGVAANDYYSLITTDANHVDVSTAASIDATTVTQTLSGQAIYYAVSLDNRETFSVFTGGAQRHIASNQNSVHGGTDGNWYYRNDADAWTAATTNTAAEAVSLAVEAGSTNNRMTGANLAALTTANWVTLGFEAGVSEWLDLGATLFTNDEHAAPTVESVAFTFTDFPLGGGDGGGGGGGGSDPVFAPSELAIDAPACSAISSVVVVLTGNNVSDYVLADNAGFVGASWTTFTPDENQSMSVTYTFHPGDGDKTLYVKFRSSDQIQSSTLTAAVTIDQAGACTDESEDPGADEEEDPELPESETPVDPENPEEPVEPEPEIPEKPVEPESISMSNFSVAVAVADPICLVPPSPPASTSVAPSPAPATSTPSPLPDGELVGAGEQIPEPEVEPAPEPEPAPEAPVENPTPEPELESEDEVQATGTRAGLILGDFLEKLPEEEVVVGLGSVTAGAFGLSSMALLATSSNLMTYLLYALTSPALLMGRQRRQNFGQVYNSVTKLPIGLAVIRVYSAEDRRLLKTVVSSPEGKFFLSLEPGMYHLEAAKPDFSFPSTYLSGATQDGKYSHVYSGQDINVTDKGTSIAASIPLDPADTPEKHSRQALVTRRFVRSLQFTLGFIGPAIALVVLIIRPNVFSIVGLLLQLVVLAVVIRLVKAKKPTGWGLVTDESSHRPVKNAMVRVFEPKYNKLVASALTDGSGRYAVMLGPNEYYATYSKPGYEDRVVRPVDTTKQAEPTVFAVNTGLRRVAN